MEGFVVYRVFKRYFIVNFNSNTGVQKRLIHYTELIYYFNTAIDFITIEIKIRGS